MSKSTKINASRKMRTDLQELSAPSHELSANKKVNVQNTCRLCMLTGTTRMESIFQVCDRLSVDASVAEKITNVTQLSPCVGDGLPSVVCQQCVFQLDVAEAFIQRCKQSDTSLRSIFKQEATLKQGATGISKPNLPSVETSIPSSLIGSVVFAPTNQKQGTAPSLGISTRSKLIPPPLSSKQCTLSEHYPATKGRAEAITEPVTVAEDTGIHHKSSSKSLVGTLGDQTATRLHLEKASNISCLPLQKSLSDSGIHAQAKVDSHSESQSKEMPISKVASKQEILLGALVRGDAQLAAVADTTKWFCNNCGMVIDQRTPESRHTCLTCLVPPPPSARASKTKRTSTRVQLFRALMPGQLHQVQKQALVVIQRLPKLKKPKLKKPKSKSAPVTESERDSQQGSILYKRDYRREQRKCQLLHEMLALKQMRQRLQARLAPMAGAEQRETVKLTQLKFKLQSKLQEPITPTTVVCSPDVSVHLEAAESVDLLSDANSLSLPQFVQVKVEPGLEEPVMSSPRRNKRRLAQTDSQRATAHGSGADRPTNITEGVVGKIKTEVKSEECENDQIVNSNVNQYCSNKKFKHSP